MRVLLIGYGSIGRRHDEVLSTILEGAEIHVVTKQCLSGRVTYAALTDVEDLQAYDYFLIASETNKHFEQLCWLNERLRGKKIFCEKPLFEKFYDLPAIQNDVYVGYVLRFHPVLQKIKALLNGRCILSANVACGSYLPNWRTNIDYRESYSAKRSEGGGVLLDLSHELDYCSWLTGHLIDVKSYQVKVSELEIDSDDLVSLVGKTDRNVIVNLVMDYFTKADQRVIRINTNEFTLEADLINNKLTKTNLDKSQEVLEFDKLERNHLFQAMHQEILFSDEKKFICSLKQGLNVMRTINIIQEENNE